ncbi:MAG: hypothetical protein FWF50_03970 [Defluviitaleaceae bacterium]|nr:hypothetical protein [Defluviitaleaceae bacterium]
MSLPRFPNENLTREDAINQILSSIAMEKVGLSHIINAEGEKIQYILGTLEGSTPPAPPTIEQVLSVNESVKTMLETVSSNQLLLKGKMADALSATTLESKEPVITIGTDGTWEVDGVSTGVIARGPAGPQGKMNASFWFGFSSFTGDQLTINANTVIPINEVITESGEGDIVNDNGTFTLVPGSYLVSWSLSLQSFSGPTNIQMYANGKIAASTIIAGINLNGRGIVSSEEVITMTLQAYSSGYVRLNTGTPQIDMTIIRIA